MTDCTCDAGTEIVEDQNGDPVKERCPACGKVHVTFRGAGR